MAHKLGPPKDNIFSLWNHCKLLHALLPMHKVDVSIPFLSRYFNEPRRNFIRGKTGLNPPFSNLGQHMVLDREEAYTFFIT